MIKIKYFFSDYCQGCMELNPIIKKISNEGYNVEFIDVQNDEGKTFKKYGVANVPTTVIIKNEKPVLWFIGTKQKDNILKKVKEINGI